jgi:GPH family glycoside/pentoside/hexuronide:cation symporter
LNRFIGRLSKLLEALALILFGVLFGYVSGEDPGPNPDHVFRILMSAFPIVCLATAWLLARSVRLDDEPVVAQA